MEAVTSWCNYASSAVNDAVGQRRTIPDRSDGCDFAIRTTCPGESAAASRVIIW